MCRIVIIADDLTGAADCSAMFAELGFRSMVLLESAQTVPGTSEGCEEAQVLAVDANTRCLGAEDAAGAVSRMVRRYSSHSDLIFKKVDSTLRGNVGAELAAVLRATGERAASSSRAVMVFAPAFPACGRTTVNGRQFVDLKPLEQSDMWRREVTPPHTDIAGMLAEAGLSCALIDLACVRAEHEFESRLLDAANRADVVVCDAESDEDLAAIVRGGSRVELKIIWAGSAGLAKRIAQKAVARTTVTSQPKSRLQTAPRRPALFVVGTPAEASRDQARTLAGAQDIPVFTFSPAELLRTAPMEAFRRQASLVSECLANGKDVLLQFDPEETLDPERGAELARALALLITPCAKDVGALVATGGETARAVLDAWGIVRLRVLGELEPGLPYSTAECAGREILILTKAGGFGTRETLLRCHEFVHSRNGEKPL